MNYGDNDFWNKYVLVLNTRLVIVMDSGIEEGKTVM